MRLRRASLGCFLWLAAAGIPTSAGARAPLHDPNLPSVPPEALRQLSDNRIRQRIMMESQAPYRGRCVCAYQTKDSGGRSCKGRHEVVKTRPVPICTPTAVTDGMVKAWRKRKS